MRNQTQKQKPKRERMRSFEADEDVDSMLKSADEAGATLKDIINRALRKYGREAIKAEAAKLRSRAANLEKTIGVGNG